MKRSGPLGRDSGKLRDWERRSRKRLRPRSPKRQRQLQERERVRVAVIERDEGCVAEGIDGVPHGRVGGRAPLEVHELKRGQMRGEVFLDPDWCVAVCPVAHDWATVEGYPEPARAVGLACRSTDDDPGEARRRRVAAGGSA